MTREETEKLTQSEEQRGFLTSIWSYILAIVFGLILSIGIWNNFGNMPTGDDINWQSAQLETATNAWRNGQIIPQVNPEAIDGAGYGFNLFAGPLPSYLATGIHFVTNSWPITINLILIFCLIFSGITMCYAVSKISNNHVLGALAGILYMSTPYLLTNLYMRAEVDELCALAVAPLFLLGLFYLIDHKPHAVRVLILSATILILTHSLSAILIALIAMLFLIFNIRHLCNLEILWRIVLVAVGIIGVTAFFTLPIVEARLNGNYAIFNTDYLHTFAGLDASLDHHRLSLSNLLNLDLTNTETSLTLGLFSLIGLLGFWFIRSKIEKTTERNFTTSLYIIMVLAIFFVLPVFSWNLLPINALRIRFPWQLLELFALISPVITGYTLYYGLRDFTIEKQKICVILTGILALSSVQPFLFRQNSSEIDAVANQLDPSALYAPTALVCNTEDHEEILVPRYLCSNQKLIKNINSSEKENSAIIEKQFLNDAEEDSSVSSFSESNEETPIPSEPILYGDANIKTLDNNGLNYHIQISENESGAILKLPLIYYPGYIATINQQKLTITASPEDGLTLIQIPAETNGIISVSYGLSRATELGGLITLATLGISAIWLLIDRIIHLRRHKETREAEDIVESVREVLEFNEEEEDAALIKLFADSDTKNVDQEPEDDEQPKPKPKRRGRPPKNAQKEKESAEKTQPATEEAAVQPKKRGRKKSTAESADTEKSDDSNINDKQSVTAKPKRRGRPPKNAQKEKEPTEEGISS